MITIVIPLYNKEHTIKQSICSILSQSYTDYEIIVVDDGSTDNGKSVVEAIKDNRIQIITQQNQGPSAARNTGVRQAKGEWLVFLDADDELCENALQHMAATCSLYQNADIIDYNKYLRINGELLLQRHPIEGSVNNPAKAWYFKEITPGCGHSIFKTSFVRKYPYNEQLRRYEDAELLIRMLPVANVFSSTVPTEIHDMDTAAASIPRKDIDEDYVGHLTLNGHDFWIKMCIFRLFVEEREHYSKECRQLYPLWYKRYDLLLLYKLLRLI